MPGFLWFLLFLNYPWSALGLAPALMVLALARPRLGTWASSFRGFPAALAVLLVLPWARGGGKAIPGGGYGVEALVSALFQPWLQGWKAGFDF